MKIIIIKKKINKSFKTISLAYILEFFQEINWQFLIENL